MPAVVAWSRLVSGSRALLARLAYGGVAQTLYWIAVLWRRALVRTRFVAVTGTHGKTTTKELLAGVLGSWRPTIRGRHNENSGLALTLNVLRVRPWHAFAVLEVGVGAPGEMRRLARLVRPDVAVVLAVLKVHIRTFATREEHAAEKAILLEALPRGGVAVLNGDDPLVARMSAPARATTLRFGAAADAEVRADGARSRWPGRLELDVHTRSGESCHVRTRLVGTHWSPAVAAALAGASRLGLPLARAAAAIGTVEPFTSRMQPMLLPGGAVLLRDDYDGSYVAFTAALAVLAEARAGRRIVVLSDVSDYGATMRRKRLAHLGRETARVAEVVAFVGEGAAFGKRAAVEAGVAPGNAHAFANLREAAAFLAAALAPGDLVLLKGRITDHVSRLFFASLGPIGCWRSDCTKVIGCDVCPELGCDPVHVRRTVPAPLPPAGTGEASGAAE
jgi:UDP-N-acetylmuramoyl-tripeptide--D-alanyl-D-alanine ligase